ncbi:hypothetical protein GZ77_08080 [Endozoicomonas montiporae]|uniref:Uncharacterized protein n=2 Tax=Endozoicomonas montiporae TaxID=1027273 RepID=A0A081N7B8_9GAMM|nr:hypothetical protein [Endozoicomonas montiporae]AMO55821.1 hypothetical protein EZMO1_1672 [Endozoicomonas montiporae CL-33]KEQ14341.1 hypothetical protein GZ77_08080 [Endozoicomonas montiporae]
MSFKTEPTGYIKTAISDLQGSWENLRNAVNEHFGFPDSDKLMFHIHEGMSWESVRNLNKMKDTLLLVRNIAQQGKAPDEVMYWLEDVQESFELAVQATEEDRAE